MNCDIVSTTNWDAVSSFVAALGVLVAAVAVYTSTKVAYRLQQRAHLLPIWKEMLELSRVDSAKPDPEDVRVSLNLLHLVAQCYALKIVDRIVLKKMFGRVYVDVYKDIDSIHVDLMLGGTTKPGRDFLADNSKVTELYQTWDSTSE